MLEFKCVVKPSVEPAVTSTVHETSVLKKIQWIQGFHEAQCLQHVCNFVFMLLEFSIKFNVRLETCSQIVSRASRNLYSVWEVFFEEVLVASKVSCSVKLQK